LYTVANLNKWINEGRQEIASEGQCVRYLADVMTVVGQEVYNFSDIVLPTVQGYGTIISVGNISIIWGSFRYTIARYGWNKYQAYCRNYIQDFYSNPTVGTQFGQGVTGSIYMYPPPDEIYVTEWDCLCLPIDLVDDTTPEVIPVPWTTAVQYYAAFKAYQSAQRFADADLMWAQFEKFMKRARSNSQRSLVSNPYARP
jgi:hypothetical protein